MDIQYADRINKLPPYLFAKIDVLKKEAIKRGVDIINLGIGDPDIPTPGFIIEALKKAAEKSANHRYPDYEGMIEFRSAVARWYKRRFGVELDPQKEVMSLIGSKEGIGHIFFAFVNPGDITLVPDPGYPVYSAATVLCNGEPYYVPLLEKNGFLPDFDAIDPSILDKAKLMFINYPNNPTGAVADLPFFEKVIKVAQKHNIIVCHDAAYSEVAFDGYRPASFLEAPGAMEVGVEFHSLSKTFNMTGWRIGFCAGNEKILAGLGKVKTNLDSGVFQAVQEAGICALDNGDNATGANIEKYQRRRDILLEYLRKCGFSVFVPKATFYLWMNVPKAYNSSDFAMLLLNEAGIVATPGVGFGKYGEGYIRFAITVDEKRIREAGERIQALVESGKIKI